MTDHAKQMERWTEHYQRLYSRETVVTDTAVENTSTLPVMKELDDPSTIEDLSKAIDSLASSKAPGNDGIPPEVIKVGKDSSLLVHLHELLLQCWEEGSVPQDMCDAKVIAVIAITVPEYPSLALSARPLPMSEPCTQKHSAGFKLRG